MKRAMWLIALMVLLLGGQAQAQQINQAAERGLYVAKNVCAECHAVERSSRRSPDPAAPRFEAIANSPGTTATTISDALQTRPHSKMPNFRMNSGQFNDVVSYILSLKRNR
jgi:mono/diheme cytochrome c family protein